MKRLGLHQLLAIRCAPALQELVQAVVETGFQFCCFMLENSWEHSFGFKKWQHKQTRWLPHQTDTDTNNEICNRVDGPPCSVPC